MKQTKTPDWAKIAFEEQKTGDEIAVIHFKGQPPYLWVRDGERKGIAVLQGRTQLRKLAKTILEECK